MNHPDLTDLDLWARKALDAPVMCVRTPTGDWTPSVEMTFAEWIDGGGFDVHSQLPNTGRPPVSPS